MHEQVEKMYKLMKNKSKISLEQVMNKSWTGYEQLEIMSWTSHTWTSSEKVIS